VTKFAAENLCELFYRNSGYRSPLAREVGAKGYHAPPFAAGP
jgi:hypothetical protein